MEREFNFKISSQPPKTEEVKKGFLKRILASFGLESKNPVEEKKLAGRIHSQMIHKGNQIVEQVERLRESLRQELKREQDSRLWPLFDSIVKPLLREYGQIEKKLQAAKGEGDAVASYHNWVERAKLLAALSAKPSDRESVILAVVNHVMTLSDTIIERDLKMIREYLSHELNELKLPDELMQTVVRHIENEMAPHIEGLLSLVHDKPDDLQIDSLEAWKGRVDQAREHHYNQALHVIDVMIDSLAPRTIHEEEHEHLKEIFSRVAYLEEELPVLLRKIGRLNDEDDYEKQISAEELNLFEIEVHKLNEDLRLTPELADRVMKLINDIEEGKRFLQEN